MLSSTRCPARKNARSGGTSDRWTRNLPEGVTLWRGTAGAETGGTRRPRDGDERSTLQTNSASSVMHSFHIQSIATVLVPHTQLTSVLPTARRTRTRMVSEFISRYIDRYEYDVAIVHLPWRTHYLVQNTGGTSCSARVSDLL